MQSNSRVKLMISTTSAATPGNKEDIVIRVYSDDSIVHELEFSLQIVNASVTRKRPFLVFDSNKRTKMLSFEYKKNIVSKYITQANSIVSSNNSVPAKAGTWLLHYVCKDGSTLQYDENSPDRFYCPSLDTWYTGDPYASSWISRRHNQLGDHLLTLGIAYHFTGNQSFAKAASDIFMKYATFYPTLPVMFCPHLSYKKD
jgi:hypothetical protein